MKHHEIMFFSWSPMLSMQKKHVRYEFAKHGKLRQEDSSNFINKNNFHNPTVCVVTRRFKSHRKWAGYGFVWKCCTHNPNGASSFCLLNCLKCGGTFNFRHTHNSYGDNLQYPLVYSHWISVLKNNLPFEVDLPLKRKNTSKEWCFSMANSYQGL